LPIDTKPGASNKNKTLKSTVPAPYNNQLSGSFKSGRLTPSGSLNGLYG
jgi:hypothetical protein